MRRWIAFIVLAGIVLAVAGAACSEHDAIRERIPGHPGEKNDGTKTATDEGATPTLAVEATDTPPLPMATVDFYQLPTGEPIGGGRAAIEAEDAQRLRSLAPPEDEVGAAFPDLAPFEQELRGDLGQEYEHVDLAKHGFVAGYVAFYRPSDESHTAYITFALFDDASGASSSLREMMAEEWEGTQRPGTSTFEVGQGEEAHGIAVPASQDEPALTVVLLRQGRVVAFMVIIHPNGEDRREGMRQLARDVAGNIEDALAQ